MKNFNYAQIILGFFLVVSVTAQAQISPQGISLQGKIVDSNNSPLEDASVTFTIQVLSPGAEQCILFEETHVVNMTGSGGVFSLPVGGGTRVGAGFKDTSTLAQIFNNASGIINSLTCSVGTSYTPATGNKRKIKMTFDNGSGPQVVTTALDIQAVPFALYADSLQGKMPSHFLQTSAQTTQTKIDNLAIDANYNELLALINGTSTGWVKANGSNFTPAADVDFNGKKIVDLAAPTNATDAVNKNYSDTKFGGATLDQTGLANGQSIRWNSVASKWEVYTPSTTDSTKLPLAGGTMTGAIDMGGNNLLAAGHITMSSQKTIHLGSYTDAQEATLVAGLAGIDEGKIWYNSDANRTKIWTGAAPALVQLTSADIGTAAGKVMAADVVPHCTSGQKLEMSAGPVYTWSCVADVATQWTASGSDIYYNSGKVGIGTGSPQWPLHIEGATAGLAIFDSDMAIGVANPAWNIRAQDNLGGGTGGLLIQSTTDYSAYSARFAIGNTGSVGIGTTSPLGKLDVVAASNTRLLMNTDHLDLTADMDAGGWARAFRVTQGNNTNGQDGGAFGAMGTAATPNYVYMAIPTADSTGWNSTKIMVLNNSGNVGIGTTSPSYKLDVNGSVNSSGGYFVGPNSYLSSNALALIGNGGPTNILVNQGTAAGSYGTITGSVSVDGYLALKSTNGNGTTDYIKFQTGNNGATEAMRIISNGNVGIGTSTPAAKLDVAGDIKIGNSSATCDGTTLGSQRYNSTSNKMEFCNGTAWANIDTAGGGGTVTSVSVTSPLNVTNGNSTPALTIDDATTGAKGVMRVGTGLSVSSGTVSVDSGTGNNQIVKLDGTAKLPAVDGSALTNVVASTYSGVVPINKGGTNATTASDARTNLGLVIGTDIQAYDAQLADIAGLATTADNFIVGNGSNFVLKTPTQSRTSLGLGTAATSSTGSGSGDLTTNTNIPHCTSGQKLEMSAGPVYTWSCVADVATQWTASGSDIYYNSGKVGIGTGSPQWPLHIEGANPGLAIFDSDVAIGVANPAWNIRAQDNLGGGTGGLLIQSTNDYSAYLARFAISNTGSVGIGTGSPDTMLHLKSGADAFTTIKVENTSAAGVLGDAQVMLKTRSSSYRLIANDDTNEFSIWDDNSGGKRMTIDSGGSFTFGTLSSHKSFFSGPVQQGYAGAQSYQGFYSALGDTTSNGDIKSFNQFYLGVAPSANQSSGAQRSTVDAQLETTNNADSKYLISMNAYGSHMGTGTVSHLVGSESIVRNGSTGTVNYLRGGDFGAFTQNGTATDVEGIRTWVEGDGGTVSNLYGLRVYDVAKNAGTVTNRYGIKIESFTGSVSADDFGIYQSGSAQSNYFAGKVGIGTPNPTSTAHIYKNANSFQQLTLENASSSGDQGDTGINLKTRSANYFLMVNDETAHFGLVDLNAGVSRFTIDPSGNIGLGGAVGFPTLSGSTMYVGVSGSVGIGMNNPSYPLDVTGDIRTSQCLRYNNSTLGSCSSDARIKKDIRTFRLGLNETLGLKPKYFRYNGLGEEAESLTDQLGVIAQDVEKVAPDLISYREVKLQPEDTEKTTIKTVNYSAFTYMLINAVKELYKMVVQKADKAELESKNLEIQNLKRENAEIKNRLERLEKLILETSPVTYQKNDSARSTASDR